MPLLFQRRTIWWPSFPGWAALFLAFSAPLLLWGWRGESFLALTERQPADVLVFEGWVGTEGLRTAKVEFDQGAYRYIVTTGGLTGKHWNEHRWSQVEIAGNELRRLHVSPDKIIAAPVPETDDQRTFTAAVHAWRSLQARGILPKSINVFTLGAHARRSRLIFAKVFGPETKVGVIAWRPPGFESEPWWKSSERAEDLIKETVGYGFELFLNSGRRSNSPAPKNP